MPHPDFSVFLNSVGAVAFERLTGRPRKAVSSWEGLREALRTFGTSGDPRIVAAREKGLSAFGFFSSSEAMLAVVLLMVADQGALADQIASEIGWWAAYDRTAGTAMRQVVGHLLAG